jgi:hypothetical protein
MALDYSGIQQALADLLTPATIPGLRKTFIEAMERDMLLDNSPFVNVRLVEEDWEMVSLPNGYYSKMLFEVDVVAFHFTKYGDAATLRDQLVGVIKDVLRTTANRRFHASLSTSMLVGRTKFGALVPPHGGGHVALATFQVRCEADIDAL